MNTRPASSVGSHTHRSSMVGVVEPQFVDQFIECVVWIRQAGRLQASDDVVLGQRAVLGQDLYQRRHRIERI